MVAMDRTTGIQGFGAALLALGWMCEQHSPQGGRHGKWRSGVRGRRCARCSNWTHQGVGVRSPCAHCFESSTGALPRFVASTATRDNSHPCIASQQRNRFVPHRLAAWACGGERDDPACGGRPEERTTSLSCRGVIPSAKAEARSTGCDEWWGASVRIAQAPSTGTMRSASGSTIATAGASKMSGRSSLRETCPPLCSSSLRASAPSKRVRLLKAFRR